MTLRHSVAALALCLVTSAALAAGPVPAYRVDPSGFNAGKADIKAVCDSAGGTLWRHFKDYEIEPFVVQRGKNGPIVLYSRNGRGEIVVRLDTGKTYWCQYAYQFAHEFCHILCGYREKGRRNKWFEETLAETASLFAIRAMARQWKKNPPYHNWKDFRDALRSYADDVITKRGKAHDLYAKGLAQFYREHRERLEAEPCDRELNGTMAIAFLHLFEEKPEHWEAIRWLNTSQTPDSDTFQQYLAKWCTAVPDRHKPFVKEVARLYGVEI